MKIQKAYKTELDPNNEQATILEKHCGTARFAYNWGLSERIKLWKEQQKSTNAIEQHKELNKLKPTEFPYFVLSPERDPAAFEAIFRYKEVCEPELAEEINLWLAETAQDYYEYGKVRVLGEIGKENAEHMKKLGMELFRGQPFNDEDKNGSVVFLED